MSKSSQEGRGIPEDSFTIAGKKFQSRLLIGTGKYSSSAEMRTALEVSGAQIVTVAIRRLDLQKREQSLLAAIDTEKYHILPNTAGCYTAEEAIRYARLSKELGLSNLIKLEVIGDSKTLFPDNAATIQAAQTLLQEGFTVLPYITDDPIVAQKLADLGCAAVMPLAAPIGSGLGLSNPYNIRIIREMVKVPVIVDAGVGTASDAAIVMELGCDAVLMNTGIAQAKSPILMAKAMRHAIIAGRLAYLAGRIPKRLYAQASSPLEGMLE